MSPHFESNALLFVDYVKDINKNVQPITKGEDKSLAIALASIMAKVFRDTLMIQMSLKFPEYGLHKNKEYGTKQHYEAIEKHGPFSGLILTVKRLFRCHPWSKSGHDPVPEK